MDRYPNTTKPSRIKHCGTTGCLYNTKEDPEERTNLAENMPDVLKAMQVKLEQYAASRFNPDRGKSWPGACDTVQWILGTIMTVSFTFVHSYKL